MWSHSGFMILPALSTQIARSSKNFLLTLDFLGP
jgi:hypothetical protein